MILQDRDEIADQYGYQRGRCPQCHRTIWSDTSVFDCSCGYTNEPKEDEDEDKEDIEDNQDE